MFLGKQLGFLLRVGGQIVVWGGSFDLEQNPKQQLASFHGKNKVARGR